MPFLTDNLHGSITPRLGEMRITQGQKYCSASQSHSYSYTLLCASPVSGFCDSSPHSTS